MERGSNKGVKIAQVEPKVTHLLYTDNVCTRVSNLQKGQKFQYLEEHPQHQSNPRQGSLPFGE